MGANTFGTNFCLTTFGESHGEAIGGVIDGCPAGLHIDFNMIEEELRRRKTSSTSTSSQRKESDKVIFLSGVFEGKTLGTPIAFMVKNEDARPADYDNVKNVYRPSHADFTYQQKYGIRDYRGGGRSSARTLLPCVVAGCLAKQILSSQNIEIRSFVTQIGGVKKGSVQKMQRQAAFLRGAGDPLYVKRLVSEGHRGRNCRKSDLLHKRHDLPRRNAEFISKAYADFSLIHNFSLVFFFYFTTIFWICKGDFFICRRKAA